MTGTPFDVALPPDDLDVLAADVRTLRDAHAELATQGARFAATSAAITSTWQGTSADSFGRESTTGLEHLGRLTTAHQETADALWDYHASLLAAHEAHDGAVLRIQAAASDYAGDVTQLTQQLRRHLDETATRFDTQAHALRAQIDRTVAASPGSASWPDPSLVAAEEEAVRTAGQYEDISRSLASVSLGFDRVDLTDDRRAVGAYTTSWTPVSVLSSLVSLRVVLSSRWGEFPAALRLGDSQVTGLVRRLQNAEQRYAEAVAHAQAQIDTAMNDAGRSADRTSETIYRIADGLPLDWALGQPSRVAADTVTTYGWVPTGFELASVGFWSARGGGSLVRRVIAWDEAANGIVRGTTALDGLSASKGLSLGWGSFARVADGRVVGDLLPEASVGGQVVGKVGVLGPIAVGLGAYATYEDYQNGEYGQAALDAAGTALTVGSLLAPPPINVVCLVASVGLAIYQNWDTIEGWAEDIGNAVGDWLVPA